MKYMGMRKALLYLIILVLQQTTIHLLSMPLHLLRIVRTYMLAVQLGSTTGLGPVTLSPRHRPTRHRRIGTRGASTLCIKKVGIPFCGNENDPLTQQCPPFARCV